MSDVVKLNLARIGIAIGILAGIAGLFGAYVSLPGRMDAAESAIKDIHAETRRDIREVQMQFNQDHALLQRIDERTARQEAQMTRIEQRLGRSDQ